MSTQMFDSIDPARIPATAQIVAYYADGAIYGTTEARVRAIHPNATLVSISATGASVAQALDVERGDALPSQAAGWVKMARAGGIAHPWVYCNRSNRYGVEDLMANAGIATSDVSMWIATLDGTGTVAPYRYPVAAVQYFDYGPYDVSFVFEAFGPGPSPGPGGDMATQAEIEAALKNSGLEGGESSIYTMLNNINTNLIAILVQLKTSGGGGTPAPEPKAVTLNVPATTVTGTLS